MSRTWLRRSTASSALESAMVWFWHTRQRNSAEMRSIFASSSGSAAVSGASAACAAAARHSASKAKRNLGIELFQQGFDLVAQHFGGDGTDLLEADHALLVDDEGFGNAIDAEVDADAAVDVV